MHMPRRVLVVAGAAAVLAGAGSAAGAAIIAAGPVTSGVVSACYKTTAASNGSHTVLLENTGHSCPSGYTHITWNQKGQTGQTGARGPSGVVSMTQYAPDGAAAATGGWAFLGTPPVETFTDGNTAAEVTATVDEASADGAQITDLIGVCYEPVGGSSVTDVSFVFPEFAAAADSFFAQTVSGDVGDLSPGNYYVGLCAADQSDVLNGDASVTITLAQTLGGVNYAGPRVPASRAQSEQARPTH